MRIRLNDDEIEVAERIAAARMTDDTRRRSPDRPTARNPAAQRRGAVGEVAAARFLRGAGFEVQKGYELDEETESDLTVNGNRLEVMTAQILHRERTGFCVPPNKLWAARRRGAIGYLFVGTGPEEYPSEVEIQAAAMVDDIDADPARMTYVSNPNYAVENFVVRPELLLDPEDLIEQLRGLV